jgi:nucleoside-diphosphate-sugar epimerase
MVIAIAGAHGQIAMRLTPRLVARGDSVIGLIRNPDHAADVQSAGAEPVVCDLEHASVEEVSAAVQHVDAVVFAAGAGPGSGAQRKLTMDRDGAIKLLEATADRATPYVIVSSVGAENPPPECDEDVFSVYLRAKAGADAAVKASDRAWTIVRPGRLTDEPGTGRVRIDTAPFRGEVSRDDVAEVLAAVLHEPRANHRVLYVNGGEDPVEDVLTHLLSAPHTE